MALGQVLAALGRDDVPLAGGGVGARPRRGGGQVRGLGLGGSPWTAADHEPIGGLSFGEPLAGHEDGRGDGFEAAVGEEVVVRAGRVPHGQDGIVGREEVLHRLGGRGQVEPVTGQVHRAAAQAVLATEPEAGQAARLRPEGHIQLR
jgi:hypothetical protein